MKSKRKKVEKYNVGGYLQAGLAGAQTLYGLASLPAARAEFQRAQAAAPSLETPAQFYQNYRNAYDAELANLENEAIQANLATSVQALQGAGGRALVGGLPAATAGAARQRQEMLQQERALRMRAGEQLAGAEEAAIARKEARSNANIEMANQGYQAALGNIGAGLGSMGTGLMYGMTGGDEPTTRLEDLGDAVNSDDFFEENRGLQEDGFVYDTLTKKFVRNAGDMTVPPPPTKKTDTKLIEETQQNIDDVDQAAIGNAQQNDKGVNMTQQDESSSTFNFATDQEQFVDEQNKKAIMDRWRAKKRLEKSFAFGSYKASRNITFTPEEQAIINAELERERQEKLNAEKESSRDGGRALVNRRAELNREQGGMITNGEFNHKTNPIDIVQDGVKVGEATGSEVILNPTQAKKIANQSSYARKLFKSFERKAKRGK